MNDGLDFVEMFRAALMRDHAEELEMETIANAAHTCAEAVRAWLALPPSEEEIEAAAKAIYVDITGEDDWAKQVATGRPAPIAQRRRAKAALVASRAVLVRPPEETT